MLDNQNNHPYNPHMDKDLFKPLKPTSLKDEFITYMEKLILQGNLKAGEKLPAERDLAKKFKVSRPVIHEGLLTLETRGLVTLRPRHGVIVNDYRRRGNLDLLLSLLKGSNNELGPGLTEDLEHFRILMEKDIIRLICKKETDITDVINQLKEINFQMKNSENGDELAELDFQFHLSLGLACGNAIYALLFNTLKPAHMDLLIQFYKKKGTIDIVFKYHNQLIDALSEKDENRAILLIEKLDSYSGYS